MFEPKNRWAQHLSPALQTLGLNYDFSAPGKANNVVHISREDEGWISGIGARQHGFLTWCSLCTTPEQVTKYGEQPFLFFLCHLG